MRATALKWRAWEKERGSPELYEEKGRESDARTGYWKPGVGNQISKTKLAKGSLKPKGSAKEAASEAWYLDSEPAAIKPPAYTETYRSPPSLRAT